MKIVHLIAGAGPMYCGSCMHGNTLAAGLRKAGADVILAPVYTPLRTDEENISMDRLAMGGINVYLDERLPLWRWAPGFIRRQLDRPSLVSWAARRGGSTRPEELGRLAVAMFRGIDGPLQHDVEPLVAWLKAEVRPQVVHLSNVMLAGLARPLREALDAPVVATLSGEDSFLEKLPPPHYAQARAELRRCTADLTRLVAMSADYADFMAGYLSVPREKIEVIRPGLNLEGFGEEADGIHQHANRGDPGSCLNVSPLLPGEGQEVRANSAEICDREQAPSAAALTLALSRRERGLDDELLGQPPTGSGEMVTTIGFFSRICEDKGLHLLIEAIHSLKAAGRLPPFRIRAAGYVDRPDQPYLQKVQEQVHELGLADRFEYVGEVDRPDKIAFLRSLDVFCLPSLLRESKGLPVLEALACGVPVVLPDRGVFRELVSDTGGGLLYDPGCPQSLAEALERLIGNRDMAEACGGAGRRAVHARYTAGREAQEMLVCYRKLLGEE